MANEELSQFTDLAEGPAIGDLFGVVDVSDTTDAASGTTKKNKAQYAIGQQVNAQTGTTYTYLTTDFRKLVTHTNASPIAATLPQSGVSFPAGWFMLVQNRGAGALTITPTTSTVDGAATLVLNQNEGAIVVSDGTNYFTMRGKTIVGAGGGAPASASYLTQVAESGLSAEFALGSLATGILKNTTTTGVPTIADVNDISSPVFAADAGANDTYTATLSPAPSAYVTGAHYRFKANTANTGTCTINFNGLGAKAIKKCAGGITTDLADNDIRAGQWVDLVYDGTNMQMQSLLGNAPSGGSGGFGDVVGPSSATDNALARFDSTTGKLIQSSTVTLDDTGAITVPEMAAPSTPATGKVSVYAKADGKLYIKDDAGTETDLTATGGGGTPGGSNTQVQYNNSGAFGGISNATSDGTTLTVTSPKVVTGINDTNGNPVIAITATGSAVNGLVVTNGATGSPGTVDLGTSGSDTNINLTLTPKGTGQTLSSKNIGITVAGTVKTHLGSTGVFISTSGGGVNWSNSSASTGTVDTGLARNAAGIVEVNNGSAATFRWLKKSGQVRVTAQFDKTNTTLGDVTGTTVALLSGQTYAFEFEADYDADAVGGQKWAIAYSSTTSNIEYHIKSICDSSNLLVITSRQTASAGSAGQAGCTAGRVRICGTLTTTGAGNLTVQFAQNAASGTSSVRTGGSFFNVWPTTN